MIFPQHFEDIIAYLLLVSIFRIRCLLSIQLSHYKTTKTFFLCLFELQFQYNIIFQNSAWNSLWFFNLANYKQMPVIIFSNTFPLDTLYPFLLKYFYIFPGPFHLTHPIASYISYYSYLCYF